MRFNNIVMVFGVLLLISIAACKPISNSTNNQGSVENGRIVFYSGRTGNNDIYSMERDGSNLMRLTADPAEDTCPAYSPDGRSIVFSSTRDGNTELYLLKSEGGEPRRLTNTPLHEIQAAFSPDGQSIAYAAFSSASWSDSDIFIMDINGGESHKLSDVVGVDSRPDFTPDGLRIIFNSTRDGNYEIYSMKPDGSNVIRLTDTEENELFPQVSPDGSKILYFKVDFSVSNQIHVMNLDGSGDVLLSQPGRVNEGAMWSPDGKYIVFQSNRDGNYEIYIMRSDGTDPTRLTEERTWDGWPDWGRK